MGAKARKALHAAAYCQLGRTSNGRKMKPDALMVTADRIEAVLPSHPRPHCRSPSHLRPGKAFRPSGHVRAERRHNSQKRKQFKRNTPHKSLTFAASRNSCRCSSTAAQFLYVEKNRWVQCHIHLHGWRGAALSWAPGALIWKARGR